MPGIRIQKFGGINTDVSSSLAREDVAQVAHNCILWDGSLRPMAQWRSEQGGLSQRYSVFYEKPNIVTKNLLHAAKLTGSVYVDNTVIGLNPSIVDADRSNICYQNKYTQIDQIKEVGVSSPVISDLTSIVYTRQYLSNKPVTRMYAASLVRDNQGKLEESPLVLLPEQDVKQIVYEGDTCLVTLRISDAPVREDCYIRLYRSISALETGQELANILDTDWYLVSEIKHYVAYLAGVYREYVFIDGGQPLNTPLDNYLANRFYPPPIVTYKYIDSTEGGWLVAGTANGSVSISERYMTHAWPTENEIKLPYNITAIVCHYDNAYVGTDQEPYIITIGSGEALKTQINTQTFGEAYPCLAGSMVETPAGALYASAAGLVALSTQGMKVVTAGAASGVTPLYKATYTAQDASTQCTTMAFQDTTYGAYFRGSYFGFCNVATVDSGIDLSLGYLFDTGSTLSGGHELQRLSTFEYKNGPIVSHCITDDGIAVLNSDSIWVMPLPNMPNKDSYDKSPKLCYRWKSKQYVFPGQVTFAFLKVVRDCCSCGFVRAKIYVDCVCVYETLVCGSEPFALPHSIVGVKWEIELHGTVVVNEVHLATSIEDMLEQ